MSEDDGQRPSRSHGVGSALALVCGVGVLIVLTIAIYRSVPPPAPDVGEIATVLRVPIEIPDFSLQKAGGEDFDLASLRGHWSFVFFGYTYCPAVCPMTLLVLHRMHEILEKTPDVLSDAQFVFVSVDPERDRDRVSNYAAYFDPSFVGVTGEQADLARLTKALGVYYKKEEGASGDEYEVDHTQALLLIDPQARLYATFGSPHDPKALAEAFRRIRKARR